MNKKAFTLIEIILVMVVVVIISSLGVVMDMGIYKSGLLRSEAEKISSLLRHARSLSINNINNSPHGLHFSNNGYVLFEGNDWDSRSKNMDLEVPANQGVAVSGANDFIFFKLSGSAKYGGDINIQSSGKILTISVNEQGQISTQ